MDSDSEPANLPGQAPRDSTKTCEVSERDLLSGVRRHRRAGRKLPLRERMMAWAAIAAVCLLAPALGLLPPLTGQPQAPVASAQEAATEEAAASGEAAGSDAAAGEKPGDHAAPHGEQAAAGAHGDGAAHAEGEHAGEEHEESHGVGHSDPVAPVLLAIVLILLLAKVGGDLFERVGMPAVLGELVVGIILGNFALLTGSDIMDPFFHIPTISEIPEIHSTANFYNTAVILKILAGIGVVLLLFEVGLESTVRQMMSVGVTSLNVALLGVVAPMGLGWLCAWLIIPDHGWQVHSFIGATLCATSVGITARVLKDLGRSQQRESQIILGAAVIDDVLGLVVLAVVAGVIQQGTVEVAGLLKVIGLALGFLAGSVLLGTMLVARPLFLAASYLRGHGMLVATSLVICFGFAWLANLVGLAPIVGAFAAGLILEKAHYRELNAREHHDLEEALAPISAMLVPIFFVQMGSQVNLRSFGDSSVWLLASSICVVAVLGKQICSLGVREKGLNRLAIGLGMIPRGEVGLIFADVGRSLRVDGESVINESTFSAVVVMVMFTTMITPPLLKWALSRPDSGPPAAEPAPPATE